MIRADVVVAVPAWSVAADAGSSTTWQRLLVTDGQVGSRVD